MSIIASIGDKFENLPAVLDSYETCLLEAEGHLSIKDKMLEVANREQAGWFSYYDQRRIELNILTKYMEANTARVRGKLYRSYVENYSRDLSDRGRDKYIDHEPAYLDANGLYLEVKDIHDKFASIVEAFKTRGFALNNITKIRVAALEDVVI